MSQRSSPWRPLASRTPVRYFEHFVQNLLHLLSGTAPARLRLHQPAPAHFAIQLGERLGDVVASVGSGSLEMRARQIGRHPFALVATDRPPVVEVDLVTDQDAGDVASFTHFVQVAFDERHLFEAAPVGGAVDDHEAVGGPDVDFGERRRDVMDVGRVEQFQRDRLFVHHRLVPIRAVCNRTRNHSNIAHFETTPPAHGNTDT